MIQWNQEDLADPKNDLCVTVNGKYVDVVQSFDGSWWPMYDNVHLLAEYRNGGNGLPTREDAMKFLENFLAEKG